MAERVSIILEAVDKASGVIQGVHSSLSSLGNVAMMGGAALIGAGTAIAGLGIAAAMTAGRVDELQLVNEVLARNAGISYDAMRAAADAIRSKGIEAAIAEQAVAKMIQADLDLASASDIARIAQDAAVISHSNSSDAYDAIIHGITTLNPLVLRNQGLIVDSQTAFDNYAAVIGKSASELSAAEKQAAFMNAVIEAGAGIAGSYEAAMENPIKQLGSMKRLFNDIAVAVGGPLLGAFSNVIGRASEWLKWIIAALEEGGAWHAQLMAISESVAGVVTVFGLFFDRAATGMPFVDNLIALVTQLGLVFGMTSTEARALGEGFGEIVGKAQDIGAQLAALLAPVAAVIGEFVSLKDVAIALAIVLGVVAINAVIALVAAFGPLLLAAAALIAAVALVRNAWENNWGDIQGINERMVANMAAMSASFQGDLEVIKAANNSAGANMAAMSASFQSDLKAVGDVVKTIAIVIAIAWEEIKTAISTAITTAKTVVATAVAGISASFTSAMGKVTSAIQPAIALINALWGAAQSFWNWLSGKVFNFRITLPSLPSWATPGSPLPIHTAWKAFADEMNSMVIRPQVDMGAVRLAALGGAATNNYYTTAQPAGQGAYTDNRIYNFNSREATALGMAQVKLERRKRIDYMMGRG